MEYFQLFAWQDCLQPLSMQALPATPESVAIIEIGGGEDETGAQRASGGFVLNIGLQVRTLRFIVASFLFTPLSGIQ